MARIDELQSWLGENQAVKDTPEYVKNRDEYRALKEQEQVSFTEQNAAPLNPASARSALADKFGSFVKTAGEDTAANPGGVSATTGRIVTGAATGVPDLGIGIYNAGARTVGSPESQVDYLGPQVNQALGGAPLPADAGTMRKLLEAGGSALLGGGATAIARTAMAAPSVARAVLPSVGALFGSTVAPTVAGHYGGETAAKLAEMLGFEGGGQETAALIGSLLGGSAATVAPGAARRYTHSRYADQGKPNAPELARAAAEQNVQPTAGLLGNETIQNRERTLSGQSGSGPFINDRRNTTIRQIGDAWDAISEARGQVNDPSAPSGVGTPLPGGTSGVPQPGTIGERITTATRETADALRARSDAGQARLMDQVGAHTPVELRGLLETGTRLQSPGQGIEPGMRANIAQRLGPAIEAMLIRRNDDRNNPAVMFQDGQPLQRPVDPYGPQPGEPPRPSPINPSTRPPPAPAPIPPMNATQAFDRYRGAQMPEPPQASIPPVAPAPERALPAPQSPASVAAPYADVRAYRTELGRSVNDPTGARLGPASALYEPVTEAMRVTADRQGVPRQDFENIQAQTRAVERTPNMPGDPTGDYTALMNIASKEPKAAFDYVYGGMQNPDRLAMLEATQHPQVPGIMGDIMRYIGNETINNPNQGAPGPRQLASAVEHMPEAAASTLFGPQQGAATDIASLARAINYPTSQTGLTRAVGGQTGGLGRMLVGSEALGHLGSATGIPGAATAGRLAGLGIMPLIRNLQARVLEGPTAINALGGGAAPQIASMPELVAAINAATAAQSQRGP